MKKTAAHFFFSFLISLILFTGGICLNSEDVVRLKASGIDDETIQIIIHEKIFETCAFSVDEILDMKNAGLGNATIQSVIKGASFMKDVDTVDYTQDIKRIRSLTVKDIIDLKNAGLSDEVITAVISGTRDEADEDHERAWQMLEKMGIIVDER